MIRVVGRRLVAALVLAFLVASIVFFVTRLAPGSPVANLSDPRVSPSHRDDLERLYGLDRPLLVQYGRWLAATASGDLGTSWSHRAPVTSVLARHLPTTLGLGTLALAIQFAIGIALGVFAARRPGGALDRAALGSALTLYALPSFVAALLAIEIFAVRLNWLPAGQLHAPGWREFSPPAQFADAFVHLLLPAAVLGLGACGAVLRFTRDGLVRELAAEYVRTARASGLAESRIHRFHALRNAAGPLIQLLGASLPLVISGSVVIEVIFSLPGLGRVAYDAVRSLDYPLTVGAALLAAFAVVLGNLIADVLHAWADPRVRDEIAEGRS